MTRYLSVVSNIDIRVAYLILDSLGTHVVGFSSLKKSQFCDKICEKCTVKNAYYITYTHCSIPP